MEENNKLDNPDDVNADGKKGGGEGSEKKFTQADIDAIVADRLKRERDKFSDYEDLKNKAKKLDDIEEANKTELERAQETARKAEEDKNAALQRANEQLVRAKFESAASRMGVKHPEDAFALADRSGVDISDDGKIEGVETAVKALVEAGRLPLISGSAPNLNNGAGDHDGDNNKNNDVEATEEQIAVAAKMNVPIEKYMENVKKAK